MSLGSVFRHGLDSRLVSARSLEQTDSGCIFMRTFDLKVLGKSLVRRGRLLCLGRVGSWFWKAKRAMCMCPEEELGFESLRSLS